MEDYIKELEDFFSQYQSKTLQKGELVISAGDEPDYVYYVQKGYVRQYSISTQGQELLLNIFKPTSYFPIYWLFDKTINNHYFEAFTEVKVWRAPQKAVSKFLKTHPDVLLDLTRRAFKGITQLLFRMESLTFGTSSAKIASALLLMSERFGETKAQTTVITLPFTHRDLATMTGLTRETTSLEMSKLKKTGVIDRKNKLIIIKKISTLQENMVHEPVEE